MFISCPDIPSLDGYGWNVKDDDINIAIHRSLGSVKVQTFFDTGNDSESADYLHILACLYSNFRHI